MDQLREDLPKKVTVQQDVRKLYQNQPYQKVLELVQSNPSLNECIDKKQFQKKINNLPQEEMNKIENEIAEDIL